MKENKIHPYVYLVTGITLLPVFFVSDNLVLLAVITLLIYFLNRITGRKINIIPSLVISFGIIITNLLQPGGKLLFYIISFPVTEEALYDGIKKALFLTGMIYVSKFSIRNTLKIPGKTGTILVKTFYYFEKLTEINFLKKGKPGLIKIITAIDEKLIELSNESFKKSDMKTNGKLNFPQFIFSISIITLFWGLYFIYL